ncbi:MAG: hypothetical protein WBE58_24325 [Verrucomicrobiales bacterium]
MSSPLQKCRTYRVGPWRRAIPWLLFGPFLLIGAGILIFAKDEETRTIGSVLFIYLGILTFFMHFLIGRARLELSPQGVRLRQIGMNLTTSWSNVAGLRLDPGREGIVTRESMSGAGAAALSAVRGGGASGVELYDEEQQLAMEECRWIPIEAFRWHLIHGQLRNDIRDLAPEVMELPAAPAPAPPPAMPEERRHGWLVFALVLSLAVLAFVLGIQGGARWADILFATALSIVALLVALRAVISAWQAFRSRSWIAFLFLILLALLVSLLCLLLLSYLSEAVGGGS